MSEPVVEPTVAWDWHEDAGLYRMTYTDPTLPEPVVLGFTPAALMELGSRVVLGEQQEQQP